MREERWLIRRAPGTPASTAWVWEGVERGETPVAHVTVAEVEAAVESYLRSPVAQRRAAARLSRTHYVEQRQRWATRLENLYHQALQQPDSDAPELKVE